MNDLRIASGWRTMRRAARIFMPVKWATGTAPRNPRTGTRRRTGVWVGRRKERRRLWIGGRGGWRTGRWTGTGRRTRTAVSRTRRTATRAAAGNPRTRRRRTGARVGRRTARRRAGTGRSTRTGWIESRRTPGPRAVSGSVIAVEQQPEDDSNDNDTRAYRQIW